MNIVRNLFYYLRNLTFICFLYASVVLYPGLTKNTFGIICLVLVIVYSLATFFMMFVKNSDETDNIFNNIVICILHFYFCFVTYRYVNSIGFELANKNFFTLNYFIASLSMFILTFNKFILWLNK